MQHRRGSPCESEDSGRQQNLFSENPADPGDRDDNSYRRHDALQRPSRAGSKITSRHKAFITKKKSSLEGDTGSGATKPPKENRQRGDSPKSENSTSHKT